MRLDVGVVTHGKLRIDVNKFDDDTNDLRTPPKHYFETLGVGEDASEAETILAYTRVHRTGGEKAANAYRVLRDYFRMAGPDPAASTRSPPRRPTTEHRPPDRYFRALGLTPEASKEEVANAYRRLSGAIVGDQDETRLREAIEQAHNILRSHFRQQADSDAEELQDAADETVEKRSQGVEAADLEETLFSGPPIIRQAYETLKIAPGAPLEEVEPQYQILLDSEATEGGIEEFSRAFSLISRWWDKRIEEVVVVRHKKGRARKQEPEPEINPLVAHYQRTLAVKPGASFAEIQEAYLDRTEELERQPSEDVADRVREAGRAFAVLARIYSERERLERRRRIRRKVLRTSALVLVIIGTLAFAVVQHNILFFRAHLVSFSPGNEVFLRDNQSHFGTIIAYDKAHQFRVGAPAPSYKIRLANSDSEIWMSRQQAVISLYAKEMGSDQQRERGP